MIDAESIVPPACCQTAAWQHRALPTPFAPALPTQALVKGMSKSSLLPQDRLSCPWLCGMDSAQEREAGAGFDSGGRDGHTGGFPPLVGLCGTLSK